MSRKFPLILSLFSLVCAAALASCSPKFTQEGGKVPLSSGLEETSIKDEDGIDDLSAYKNNTESDNNNDISATASPEEIKVELTDPVEKNLPDGTPLIATETPQPEPGDHWAIPELAGLKQILLPCFSCDSVLFIGKDRIAVFDQYIFQSALLDAPIPVGHWENLMRAAFYFRDDAESNQLIKMYITNSTIDGLIAREAAVSGMMKLISLRYPISLGGNAEDFIPSDIISDMKQCDPGFEYLVRQAYCEGLTDNTVDMNQVFRPKDYLTYAEGISTIYRVLSKYGLYVPDDTQVTDNRLPPPEETEQWILNECRDYFDKLNSDPEANAGKIACLQAAEEIINPVDTLEELSKPMDISSWQAVLNKGLNLDPNEVETYTDFGSNDVLTWDVAAVSIFKLGFRINAFDIRDASSDEIESARSAINGFDSAMDISKFAQMHSSGLLNGLYEKPGFAPGNVVMKGEALLLVKRIVEHLP